MRLLTYAIVTLIVIITGCSPFPSPRKIDWKKEWLNNGNKLKSLTKDILRKGDEKYKPGINDFPDGFDYPFDDGFGISGTHSNDGIIGIDPEKITITFYVDRGIMDHYSAFIFTNDSSAIFNFDKNVENGGNDYKIEPNWYIISD